LLDLTRHGIRYTGNNVLVVYHVGGLKASYIKLVLQRKPRIGKTWFLSGYVLPNEGHVDAAVRELFEEIGFTLTADDLAASPSECRYLLPSTSSSTFFWQVPYVIENMRTHAKVEHTVTAQSAIHPDGTYVVPKGYADACLFGSLQDSQVTAHFRAMHVPSEGQLGRDVHLSYMLYDSGDCISHVARSRRRTSISLLIGAKSESS
jgi:8-oxo-dGTP pyrophosphatase MutT (NUDIX family)